MNAMPDKCQADHRLPTAREILIYICCIETDRDWTKYYKFIRGRKTDFEDDNPTIVRKVAEYESEHECVTLLDEEYPKDIKHGMLKPPFVLVDYEAPAESDRKDIQIEFGHTKSEYDVKFGILYKQGMLFDFEPSELFDGSVEPRDCMTYWEIDGRLYETL